MSNNRKAKNFKETKAGASQAADKAVLQETPEKKGSATARTARPPQKKPPFVLPNMVRLGLILLIITGVVALLLAVVNGMTAERIELLAKEKFNEATRTVMPGVDEIKRLDFEPVGTILELYGAKADGSEAGYILRLAPLGFGGTMDVVAGVDLDGKLTGVSVISNKETAGLGSRVTDEKFTAQFAGKANPIALVKNKTAGEGEVAALSGATISSRAVTDSINEGLLAVAALKGAGTQ